MALHHPVLRSLGLLGLLAGCATASRPQPAVARAEAVSAVAGAAIPLTGQDSDYDPLLALIGDHRFVLLGESTHGSEEFYRERARITRRLVEEKGFTVVAVEADWADAFDVNEHIHSRRADGPGTALRTFERFPAWTWNNAEIAGLVAWMRDWNASARGREQPVGFYGIDLYNITESARRVVTFLERVDPRAATTARERYGCFDRLEHDDLVEYGRRVVMGERRSCADGVAQAFLEMTQRVGVSADGHRPGDEALIDAWQNARVAMNGEAYFRFVHAGGTESWNLRDKHMADTIDMLSRHLDEGDPRPAKVVVWAHNSHLGDARTTARSDEGERRPVDAPAP